MYVNYKCFHPRRYALWLDLVPGSCVYVILCGSQCWEEASFLLSTGYEIQADRVTSRYN